MLTRVFAVIDKVFSFIEDWVLFLSTMAALIALFIGVILRYGFNYALAWSEELVREVIIVTTFIGCSAATKVRAMVKVDAVIQLIPVTKYSHHVLCQPGDAPVFRHDDLLRLEACADAGGHHISTRSSWRSLWNSFTPSCRSWGS